MIYKNGRKITSIHIGGKAVTAVYKGSRCVWRARAPVPGEDDLKVFPKSIQFTAEGGSEDIHIITEGGWEIS